MRQSRILSIVKKTGPDRPVGPVGPGTGHQADSVIVIELLAHKTGDKLDKTGINRWIVWTGPVLLVYQFDFFFFAKQCRREGGGSGWSLVWAPLMLLVVAFQWSCGGSCLCEREAQGEEVLHDHRHLLEFQQLARRWVITAVGKGHSTHRLPLWHNRLTTDVCGGTQSKKKIRTEREEKVLVCETVYHKAKVWRKKTFRLSWDLPLFYSIK